MKFGIESRKPLHDYGIKDKEIIATGPAALTGELLAAANYAITLGSPDGYERGEDAKRKVAELKKRESERESSDTLYAPIICVRGFCSGPSDPGYIYRLLEDCKDYIATLGYPYRTSGGGNYAYCAYHAPEWHAIQ